jgi:glycosyltransferase involved in cell wall biosynthesis
MESRIAVVFPAYNEEKAVARTIRDFYQQLPQAHFYVVDNASTDQTAVVAKKEFESLGCAGHVMFEPRKGKGFAMRKAFHEIDADIYVMVDADATYVAEDLPRLLEPVREGRADLVVGNRHADNRYREQNHRPFHDFGNNLVKGLINLLFRTHLKDIMSGYRVMSRLFVKNFPLMSPGFEIETEMSLQAVDKRFRIEEFPIRYLKRMEGSFSKLSTFRDGWRVIKLIFLIFKDYRPLIFFGFLSFLFAATSLALGIPLIIEFMHTHLVPRFPTAILAMGLMTMGLMFFTVALVLDTVVKLNREQFELRLLAWPDRR